MAVSKLADKVVLFPAASPLTVPKPIKGLLLVLLAPNATRQPAALLIVRLLELESRPVRPW